MAVIIKPSKELQIDKEEQQIKEQAKERILLYPLGETLSFGAAKGMVRRLAYYDHYDAVVLDFSDVPTVGFISTRGVADMITDAQGRGRALYLINGNPKVSGFMKQQGMLRLLAEDHQFSDRLNALQYALNGTGIAVCVAWCCAHLACFGFPCVKLKYPEVSK